MLGTQTHLAAVLFQGFAVDVVGAAVKYRVVRVICNTWGSRNHNAFKYIRVTSTHANNYERYERPAASAMLNSF